MLDSHQDEAQVFGNFPSLFMGLVTPDGAWEHYDGKLRFVDSDGSIVADQLRPAATTSEFIGEAVEPWSYLKFAVLQAARLPGRDVPRRARSPG